MFVMCTVTKFLRCWSVVMLGVGSVGYLVLSGMDTVGYSHNWA